MQQRIGTITRNTKETQITLTINLDGSGKADISTGIGFFDHMLNSFARHGLFDLTVKATGDLRGRLPPYNRGCRYCAWPGDSTGSRRQKVYLPLWRLHSSYG